MFSFGIFVLAVVSQVAVGLAAPVDDVTKDTELLFTVLMHRHGDRTPTDEATARTFSSNPDALVAASERYGYGQLIKPGKQRAYRLGQFIRRRYDELIAPQYNSSEIWIQSTDITRSKMTVLVALSAIFPPTADNAWSDDIKWSPVPYTTNDELYDPNTPLSNCQPFYNHYMNTLNGPMPTMYKYRDVLEKTSSILNLSYDLKNNSGLVAIEAYDVLRSQISLDIPLPEELQNIFPQIQESSGEGWRVIFEDLDQSALMAGVVLKEFYDYSDAILNGDDTPKVRIYSAHDANVFALESILQLTPKQGAPQYASLLGLELRKDKSGKVYVLPVYLPTPEEPEMYLQVEGCDGLLCSLDQFKEITSNYALDIDTWRERCNWSVDGLPLFTYSQITPMARLLKAIMQ